MDQVFNMCEGMLHFMYSKAACFIFCFIKTVSSTKAIKHLSIYSLLSLLIIAGLPISLFHILYKLWQLDETSEENLAQMLEENT